MGPDASFFEIALQAFGTVLLGQYLSRKLYGPAKPKLSELPFDRFGPLPDHMLNKPAEEPKPPKRISPEEEAETCRRLREMWPSLPEWMTTPSAAELPAPKPMLLLPSPLKLPLGEDGGESG